MFKIRQGLFETNSSSSHSLTVLMKENFLLWQRGEVLLNEDEDSLPEVCTAQQALDFIASEYGAAPDYKYPDSEPSFLAEYGFVSYDYHMACFDGRRIEYKTPGGEEIVVLGGETC